MNWKDPAQVREYKREYQKQWLARHPDYGRKFREYRREYVKQWRAQHPGYDRKYRETHREQLRATRRFRRLGITKEDYEQQLACQDGLCALCWAVNPNQTDHDHQTGRFRGILCGLCNRGLGLFKDRPDVLRRAAAYIE